MIAKPQPTLWCYTDGGLRLGIVPVYNYTEFRSSQILMSKNYITTGGQFAEPLENDERAFNVITDKGVVYCCQK